MEVPKEFMDMVCADIQRITGSLNLSTGDNGELLTQNNLFPPPAYDYGFDLLLSRDDLFKDSEYSIAKYV